ncbi:PAS domain-containing protein [Mesorhizobium sp. M0983]|uniref:PAS domain-containing protein n=1 Tax=unclassified Mesorhizobium TaxID=325217 RepID=UPI00333B3D71
MVHLIRRRQGEVHRSGRGARDAAAGAAPQRDRLRSMMGSAGATELAILTIDVHGVIRFANHAAGTLFGWDLAEMIGYPST